MTNANDITIAHIVNVQEKIFNFCRLMQGRGLDHDASKFHPIEAGPLQEMQNLIDAEGHAAFGSEEYARRTKLLGPMIEHHYLHNSHHPEHYPDGIAGMDLLDLVEMFLDWKAASERGQDSAIGLTYCIEKYSIPPMLAAILRNTADRLEWKHV
jgi:hypothetical protein